MTRRPFLGFDDGIQAILQAACTVCGEPAEAIVHVRDLRTEEAREQRKREMLAEIKCARCCGKDFLMAKKTSIVLDPKPESAQLIQRIAVKDIEPDPSQPRKHFETASIEATLEVKDGEPVDGRDIMLPLQVIMRPGGPPYRIKDGERRWRAAKNVGFLSIKAFFVEPATPARILEDQIKAGLTGQGLRPLEAADAIMRLSVGRRPPSAEDLAARLGLPSARKVHQFRQLAKLAPEVREALDKDDIGLGVALELATIADPALQAKALPDVRAMDLRQVRGFIRRQYHLRLVDCCFDPADNELTKAGSCETCPKNTKSQRSLWAEGESEEGMCTDKACFEDKKDAAWQNRAIDAEKKGIKVIEGEEAKRLYPHGWSGTPDHLIDLEDECSYESAEEADRATHSWREVLGNPTPSILVRREDGRVHELVTLDAAGELARKAGHEEVAIGAEEEATAAKAGPELRQPDNDEWQKVRNAQRAAAWAGVTDRAAKRAIDAPYLRFLCGMAVRADDSGVIAEVCDQHSIEPTDDVDLESKLLARIAELEDVGQLQVMLVNLLVRRAEIFGEDGESDPLPTACRFFGLEYGALEELPIVTAASGICRVCGCTNDRECEGDGLGCAWVDAEETLCSVCARLQREIADRLEGNPNGVAMAAIIEVLDEFTDRRTEAIADLIRTKDIEDRSGRLFVPALSVCRMCAAKECNCAALEAHILKLCKDKPRQGAQIKAGSRDWDKERVHAAIKVLVIEGKLDKDASGFSTVKR